MFYRNRILVACFAALMLIVPTFLVLVPLGSSIPEQEDAITSDIEVADIPLVQPNSYYNGKVIHVGGFGANNETTIQDGLDKADDRDQVWVYSGTYSEALVVRKEVWVNGASGVKLVNPGGPATGFYLEANNVTITSFNITDFYRGVRSTYSGHNISNNVFWYNDIGIEDEYLYMGAGKDYQNFGLKIWRNEFYHQTTTRMIAYTVALLYDDTGPYDVDIGDLWILENEIFSSSTNTHILVQLVFNSFNGSTIDIGDQRIDDNQVRGGGYLLHYVGNFYAFNNMTLNIGDLVFKNNDIFGLSFDGLLCDYFSYNHISGVNVITMGDIILTGNEIISSQPSSGGFNFIERIKVENSEGTATIHFGVLSVVDNIIDVMQTAFRSYDMPMATQIKDSVSIFVSDMIVQDNDIRNSSMGIQIEMNNINTMSGSSMIKMGNISIIDNDIISDSYGIHFYIYDIGARLTGSAMVEMGLFLIEGNDVRSGSYCMNLAVNWIGAQNADDTSVSWDGVLITENTFIGSEGIHIGDLTQIGYDLHNSSMVNFGGLNISNNMISSTDYGIFISGVGELGYQMTANSTVAVGDLIIDSNDIDSRGMGIYLSSFYNIGFNMNGNSNFSMGQISINYNEIISESDGIFSGMYTNLGYDMWDNSTAFFGSFLYNNNRVFSNVTGLSLSGWMFLGSFNHNNAQVRMGDLQINDNYIVSLNIGLFFSTYSYLGYYLFEDSLVEHGNILIENNIVISEDNFAIYFNQFGYNGNYLWDNSTCTIGLIMISDNSISGHTGSIYIDRIEFVGYFIDNWSQFIFGGISISRNDIDSRNMGIHLSVIQYLGYQLFQKAKVDIGEIEIIDNEIITDSDGIIFDNINYVGFELFSDSWMAMGGFTISDNIIRANGTGIRGSQLIGLGMNIHDRAVIEIGDFEIVRNDVQADIEGIYLYSYQSNGVYNEDNSKVKIGNFSVSDNDIDAGTNGIYIQILDNLGASNSDDAEVVIGYLQFNDNVITSDTQFGIHLGNVNMWGSQNLHLSSTTIMGLDISRNEITSFSSGIHVFQIENLGYAIQNEASFTLGPVTINDNDVDSNDEGVMIIFNTLGSSSVNDPTITIESIEISGNTIDSDDGIVFGMNVGSPGDNVKLNIGETIISDNLVWTTDQYSIILAYMVSLTDQVRMSMGEIHVEWNNIQGSQGNGIYLIQQANLGGTSSTDFEDITIFANNIEECSTGLNLNGTKGVVAFGNNFINNGDDTDIFDTTIKWISPTPIWYKHGMRNYTSYVGNYWDSYSGSDDNDDGIGDLPYNTDNGMDTHPLISEVENHLPPWNDVTPPEVSIMSPANGTVFNITSLTMTWMGLDDLLGIDHYEVKLNNGSWENVNMDTSFRFEDLVEGHHMLSVKAVDRAGNMETDDIEILIDITDPELSITYPENNGFVNTTSVMIEWDGMDALSGIDHYSVKMDNGSWFDVGTMMGYLFSDISESDHYVEVMAFDVAGNSIMVHTEFVMDLTSPTLDILYPTIDLYVTTNSISVEWTTDDQVSGVMETWIKLDNGSWLPKGPANAHMFLDLTKGIHEISFKVQDNAGNHILESVEFEIGDPVKVLTIVEPVEGSFVAQTSVEITWTVLGTTYKPMMFQVRLDNGVWENLSLVFTKTFSDLPDGLHTVEVKFTDAGGNIATDMVSFLVDTTEPTLLSISHSGENTPPGDPIILEFSEKMDPTAFITTLNGEAVTGVIDEFGTKLTIDVEMEAGETMVLDIFGKDLAGNSLHVNRTFNTATMGTISGRLIDPDGDPITNAKITVDTGEETYTDQNGDFSMEVQPGTRKVTVYDKDGNKLTEFEIDVDAGKEITPTAYLSVERHEDDSRSLLWLWILLAVILVMLIIGGIYFFVVRKPSEEDDEEDEDDYDDDDDDIDFDDEEYDDIEYEDDWDEE